MSAVTARERQAGGVGAGPPGSMSVVLADDVPAVRRLLHYALEASEAFRVVGEAADGLEAARLAEDLRPDVVLLDLAMPVMDGLEAIPEIRRRAPGSRIVVLSGFNAARMERSALAGGADAYVEKRYRPDELVARLLDACRPPDGRRAPGAGADDAPGTPVAPPRSSEQAAREERERFRLAFENAPIGMALQSPTGRFLQVNRSLCAMTGHDEPLLLARAEQDLTDGRDLEQEAQLRSELLAGAVPTSRSEVRYLRPDGDTVWALVSRSLLRDELGRPSQFVVQVVDITEQKRAEHAVRHFAAVLEHAVEGIARLDALGRFVEVNPAYAAMAGYQAAELLGLSWTALLHPHDAGRVAAARDRMPAGGGAEVDARAVRKDGSVYFQRLVIVGIVDDDGRPTGHYCFSKDVTAEKRGEEARTRQAEELARSNAELVEFAYVAAHDLKSPLQVMAGFAGLLEELYGPGMDEQGREFLRLILDGAGRMDALIEDLLSYCRVGSAERVTVDVDLDGSLAMVLNQMGPELEASGATVTSDPLPTVCGDPVQLGQLLQNLVANGVKFVAEGAAALVHVTAERAPEAWVVTVSDNGIGVDPAQRERIFGMFERLHARDRYQGTGIGLAVCKRIVERRGGAIWVEDAASGGSRFRFTVPDEPVRSPA